MLRRLVEANYFQNRKQPNRIQIRFWLCELRTPELLVEVAEKNTATAKKLSDKRPLLQLALAGEMRRLEAEIAAEEAAEREADRNYWQPLKKELEKLRHNH